MANKNEERLHIVVGEDNKQRLKMICETHRQPVSQVVRELITTNKTLSDKVRETIQHQQDQARQNEEALQAQEARMTNAGYRKQYLQNLDGFLS